MFAVQHRFFEPTSNIGSEEFDKIINSSEVREIIKNVRKCKIAGQEQEAQAWKRRLPAFMFQATFDETKSKTGIVGRWRKNAAARLTGLAVIDVDHVQDPVEVFNGFAQHNFDRTEKQAIALVYITPSGHGLKIVFKADPEAGNLIENQRKLALRLGVEVDEACKDAARMSFACTAEDILFRDDFTLFELSENGKEYDKLFGEFYRNPTPAQRARNRAVRAVANPSASAVSGKSNPKADIQSGLSATQRTAGKEAEEELKYGETPLKKIIDEYIKREGNPVQGDRHRHLLQMASRLRYLVDNDAEKLKKAVREADYVRAWEQSEANAGEIDDICDDVCKQRVWYNRPKALENILKDFGISSTDAAREAHADEDADEDVYKSQWDRLDALMAPPYDVCTEGVTDNNKLGAVYAAGTMFCTLMTRCWYRHFDGQKTRMNPQAYIIGDPASGKSFAYRLDREIMAVMRAADEPGRKAEADYKAAKKEKSDAKVKMPEPVIRYIPSRTSNAVFYRRALNAKEIIDGLVEHLHLYTFDSELDSSVIAQSGGSWIGKHDLELKAFQNEFSGVDYANADSVNENIQVFYNTVITGTPISLSKKITLRNVNDGLCSRIAIFRMQSSDYKMIDKGDYKRNHDTELKMKEWGYYFDRFKGELHIDRLVDYVYELCSDAATTAEMQHDKVLDYLRKRAVFYAIWFTVPRIVARLRTLTDEKSRYDLTKIEVIDSDLEFAKLMYDTVIYWQDRFFGQMLTDAWANGELSFVSRSQTLRQTQNSKNFDSLPKKFTVEEVESTLGISHRAALMQVSRWIEKGYVDKKGKEIFKK